MTGGDEKGEAGEGIALPSPTQIQGSLIHPNMVLKVLRAFVSDNKKPPKYGIDVAWVHNVRRHFFAQ